MSLKRFHHANQSDEAESSSFSSTPLIHNPSFFSSPSPTPSDAALADLTAQLCADLSTSLSQNSRLRLSTAPTALSFSAPDIPSSDLLLATSLHAFSSLSASPESFSLVSRHFPLSLFSDLLCHAFPPIPSLTVRVLADLLDCSDSDQGDPVSPYFPPFLRALLAENPDFFPLLMSLWRNLVSFASSDAPEWTSESNAFLFTVILDPASSEAASLDENLREMLLFQKTRSEINASPEFLNRPVDFQAFQRFSVSQVVRLLKAFCLISPPTVDHLLRDASFGILVRQQLVGCDEITVEIVELLLAVLSTELRLNPPPRTRFLSLGLDLDALIQLITSLFSSSSTTSSSSSSSSLIHSSLSSDQQAELFDDMIEIITLLLLDPSIHAQFLQQTNALPFFVSLLASKKHVGALLPMLDSAIADSSAGCHQFLQTQSGLNGLGKKLSGEIRALKRKSETSRLFDPPLGYLLKMYANLAIWCDWESQWGKSLAEHFAGRLDSLVFLFVNYRQSVLTFDENNALQEDEWSDDEAVEMVYLGRISVGLAQFQHLSIIFRYLDVKMHALYEKEIEAALSTYQIQAQSEITLIIQEYLALLDSHLSKRIEKINHDLF